MSAFHGSHGSMRSDCLLPLPPSSLSYSAPAFLAFLPLLEQVLSIAGTLYLLFSLPGPLSPWSSHCCLRSVLSLNATFSERPLVITPSKITALPLPPPNGHSPSYYTIYKADTSQSELPLFTGLLLDCLRLQHTYTQLNVNSLNTQIAYLSPAPLYLQCWKYHLV